MAQNGHLAMLFPGQGSQSPDMREQVERHRFVETGPGRVLTNLVRKSLDGVEADAPLDLEAANA